ncbi:MAG: hypothetical protein ACNA8K_11960 [Cyclonatronaceae bacterium]
MNRTSRRTWFITLLLLGLMVLPLQAQRHFGVIWEPPETERDAARELFSYQQLGIQTLIIDGIHEIGMLDVLHGFDFDVIVRIPQSFLTATELNRRHSAALDLVILHLDYYRNFDFVSSFILFSDSQVNNRRFTRLITPVIQEARIATDRPLMHIHRDTRHAFADIERPDGLIRRLDSAAMKTSSIDTSSNTIPIQGFIWHPDDGFDLRRFQEMLRYTRQAVDVPVFLHSGWVESHLDGGLDEVLISYAGDADAALPNPRRATQSPAANWHIILLIVVWISFAIHYAFFPNYNKSLFRYFSNHTFFTEDLFEKRIRFTATPFFLNLQTAAISGLFFYTLYSFYLSDSGLEVLKFYRLLPDSTHPGLLIFTTGFLFKLTFSTLMTLWVFAPSLDTEWLNPAAVTYIWPQHLLLAVITLMMTVHAAGGPAFIFNLLAILFLVIWLSSFYITAYNVRQHVEKTSLYDGLSWVLQIIVLCITIWWIFIYAGLLDIIRLAAFV